MECDFMKVSDYIVEYLIEKGITDVFGYPGGMIAHLMNSFSKYNDQIKAHVCYNEQGASMAACGYAQASGITGVAYTTSGPGATNMITGICNAYMDSIPTVFITGQVNSFEQKGDLKVRQRGFQETDIVAIVSPITKYAVKINSVNKLKYYLDYAFYIANEGRKGPVLLDIAMDVTKSEINPEQIIGYNHKQNTTFELANEDICLISKVLGNAKRPVILLGNGLPRKQYLKNIINNTNLPVVSSMISVDHQVGLKNYYGFVGAYGDRIANFIVAKSDLVISFGSRLDIRQVGAKRENFAPDATLIRIDIDANELEYKVHDNELSFCADAEISLKQIFEYSNLTFLNEWLLVCNLIKNKLNNYDKMKANDYVSIISNMIPESTLITTDVGQNQVWVAQSFNVKNNQRILFSGGHGAMGYSLPAAIGAYYGCKKTVYSFNGDGGIQMNIQELQWISRERLPIKIILFNNDALGMIRHFQEMYFDKNYFQTTSKSGFTSPNFEELAKAYRIDYCRIDDPSDLNNQKHIFESNSPVFIEIRIQELTYVFPKLEFGKPNQDQEPLLDRELFKYIMSI